MFLVSAPVSRRQVVAFWLWGLQPRLLLTSLVFALLGLGYAGRFGPNWAVAFLGLEALILLAQADFRLGDRPCLAANPERHRHDSAGQQQEVRFGRNLLPQSVHGGRQGSVGGGGHFVGVVAGHGHANEVDQVVGRERHSQGKGADQDDRLEDVPAEHQQNL